jgi:hypothetical protein
VRAPQKEQIRTDRPDVTPKRDPINLSTRMISLSLGSQPRSVSSPAKHFSSGPRAIKAAVDALGEAEKGDEGFVLGCDQFSAELQYAALRLSGLIKVYSETPPGRDNRRSRREIRAFGELWTGLAQEASL